MRAMKLLNNAGQPQEGVLVKLPALLQSHYASQPIEAVVRVSRAWSEQLRECSEICRCRHLSHLIIEGAPERWEYEGRDLGLPLGEADLIVMPHSFWFRDRIRGRKTVLATAPTGIDALLDLAERA
jgi:hypothetical protein